MKWIIDPSYSDVIAALPSCYVGGERSALAVGNGVQLCIHPALNSSDEASTPPSFTGQAGRFYAAFELAPISTGHLGLTKEA